MGTVALILKCEAAFREEGLPEVLLDPVLHVFAGDGDQRLGDDFRSQLPDESTERRKQTCKAALGEITFEGLQFPPATIPEPHCCQEDVRSQPAVRIHP